MPHTSPILHIATNEIPTTNGSAFSGLMSTISKGLGFATGTNEADQPVVEVEMGHAVEPYRPAPKYDPCRAHVTALQRCLDQELSSCQQSLDSLLRCIDKSQPRNEPKAMPFFTR